MGPLSFHPRLTIRASAVNKEILHDRRNFLTSSAFLAAAAVAWPTKKTIALGPVPGLRTKSYPLYRVRMEIAIKGNLDVPKDPLVSKVRDQQVPLTGNSIVDYEERVTRNDGGAIMAAHRYYYEAETEVTAGGIPQTSVLGDDHRRLIVRSGQGTEVVYSDEQFLNQTEIDLLQTPVSSLAIDQLLPTDEPRAKQTWNPETETLARLLNLETVTKSEVVGTVVSIDAAAVKMRLDGRLDATVEGVSTSIDLVAKMTFDRNAQCVTWFAIAVRERRDIGLARPGFEIAATVKLVRQPLENANAVRETDPIDLTVDIPKERLLVNIESQSGGFHAFMDRQWKLISDQPGLSIMRMIVDESSIAQCNLRPLPSLKPGEQWTLEAFQNEIQRSLGDRFVQFIEAEEGLNGGQLRTMRVAVMGQVNELPVQWVFLQFSDDSGRRLAANFSVPSKNVEVFGGADAQLANSLHFTPISPAQSIRAPEQAKLDSDTVGGKSR